MLMTNITVSSIAHGATLEGPTLSAVLPFRRFFIRRIDLWVLFRMLVCMIKELTVKTAVNEVCQAFRVRRLYAFGSSVKGGFNEDSDYDFIVEFDRDGYEGAFDQFMDFKSRLEAVLKRPVDLITSKPFRNPVFQEEIESTRVLVYAASC